MRRVRKARKLCCVGVDLPLDAGTCGRKVHAESQRCIHRAKRRWWLIKHALNDAEVTITTILEDDTSHRAIHDDTLDDLAGIVPNFDDLSDLGLFAIIRALRAGRPRPVQNAPLPSASSARIPTSSLIVISRARRRRP